MMVVPIVNASNTTTLLTKMDIWIPEGEWYEQHHGRVLKGPTVLKDQNFDLSEIPVYIKTGSVIPKLVLRGSSLGRAGKGFYNLAFNVYLSSTATSFGTSVYQDDGYTNDYMKGAFARTVFDATWEKSSLKFTGSWRTIGSFSVPTTHYYVLIHGVTIPKLVTCSTGSSSGTNVPRLNPNDNIEDVPGWVYYGDRQALHIFCGDGDHVTVTFTDEADTTMLDGFKGIIDRCLLADEGFDNVNCGYGGGRRYLSYCATMGEALTSAAMTNYTRFVDVASQLKAKYFPKAVLQVSQLLHSDHDKSCGHANGPRQEALMALMDPDSDEGLALFREAQKELDEEYMAQVAKHATASF